MTTHASSHSQASDPATGSESAQYQSAGETPPSSTQASFGIAPSETGQLLSVIGLVMVMWFPPAGLILSIIGYRYLRRDGQPTLLGTLGIWLNGLGTVIILAFIALWILVFGAVFWQAFFGRL